jgi:hypothetical protein
MLVKAVSDNATTASGLNPRGQIHIFLLLA